MRTPTRTYATRRKWYSLGPGMIAAIAIVLVFGGLWISGRIDPIHFFFAPKAVSHKGEMAIPVAATPIPAFSKITRDNLWNGKTGTFSVIYMRPELVTPEIIRFQSRIIGRVMDHDKPANYVFTEADFLPPGTKPGLVAGIPAGKRALRIPSDRIPGLVGLRIGDRFDLISALPINANGGALAASGIYSRQLELQAQLTDWQKQAIVRVIVGGGDIVQPSSTRTVPFTTNGLTSGSVTRTRPVIETVIAVTPREVAPLLEALAIGSEITCVPRSGRPEEDPDMVTPESDPWSPYGGTVHRPKPGESASSTSETGGVTTTFGKGFTPVETISGSHREIVATPVKR